MTRFTRRLIALSLSLSATGAALALDDTMAYTAVDSNTFIMGHPASPRWQLPHANHPHPAVAQAAMAHPGEIDPNTFLVQPPASVHWTAPAHALVHVRLSAAR